LVFLNVNITEKMNIGYFEHLEGKGKNLRIWELFFFGV
jgi:hypothetical protein